MDTVDQLRVRVRHFRRRLLFRLIHHAPEEEPRCLRTHARQDRPPHRRLEWGPDHRQRPSARLLEDLQEDKEPLFDAVGSVLAMLAVLPEMLQTARFDGVRMAEAAGGFALATELADYLAAKGIPFREAHHAVGR